MTFDTIRNRFARLRRPEITEEDELTFSQESGLNYDRDPFLHSLNALVPEDIRLAKTPRVLSRSEKLSDSLRRVMLFICIAVFAVSCGMLINNMIEKQKGGELYSDAAEEFAAAGLDFGLGVQNPLEEQKEGAVHSVRRDRADSAVLSLSAKREASVLAQEESGEEKKEYNEQLEKLRAVLRTYKERNEDVYGYISIPMAGIEYVVVQGEDNDYYLNHNYKGEYLVIGSIFVDYRCDEMIMRNFNTVFYGHNIFANGNSAMFHNVTKFFEPDIFEEGLIYIYTMDGVYIYKPFSIYKTDAASGYIRTGFTSTEDYLSFAAAMKDRSQIASDITVDAGSRIITLSTCTNETASGSYAMHAVLIDYIT